MAKVLLHVIFVCLPLIVGCATQHSRLMESAQTHYQTNAYEAALNDAVAALKLKPDYQPAQDLAPTVFKAAVEAREAKIKEIEPSPDKFKWDEIVAQYKGLIKINNLVKNLPPLTHKKTKERITFDTKDYTEQLSIASGEAAEAHYQEGIRFAALSEGDVLESQKKAAKEFGKAEQFVKGYKDSSSRRKKAESAADNMSAEKHYQEGIRLAALSDDVDTQKKAAKEFGKAEGFVKGYKDSRSRYEEAKSAGTKRIAIILENKSGKEKYGAVADMVADQITTNILNNSSAAEFSDLVSRSELERVIQEQQLSMTGLVDDNTAPGVGKLLGVHEIVTGRISYIDYIAPDVKKETFSKESTVQKAYDEEYIDKEGKKRTRTKYKDVLIKAHGTIFSREASAKTTISYKVIQVQSGKILKSGEFTGSSEFKYKWGKCFGDELALSRALLNICKKPEKDPPPEPEMVREVLGKAADNFSSELIDYVR